MQRRGGRVTPQPAAQVRGVEPETIAHVLEGEGPARIGDLDPLARLRSERPALASRPDLANQATDRVLQDGAHERALTGGPTRPGHDCVAHGLPGAGCKCHALRWRGRGTVGCGQRGTPGPPGPRTSRSGVHVPVSSRSYARAA